MGRENAAWKGRSGKCRTSNCGKKQMYIFFTDLVNYSYNQSALCNQNFITDSGTIPLSDLWHISICNLPVGPVWYNAQKYCYSVVLSTGFDLISNPARARLGRTVFRSHSTKCRSTLVVITSAGRLFHVRTRECSVDMLLAADILRL